MVKYYGRARQRIGSVNTNQLGLKMSGCPSRVGRNPVNARYISQRVNCMNGTCGPVMIHGVPYYPNKFRNKFPYCKNRTSTCQAAAGGVGHINSPYSKSIRNETIRPNSSIFLYFGKNPQRNSNKGHCQGLRKCCKSGPRCPSYDYGRLSLGKKGGRRKNALFSKETNGRR